MTTVAGTGVPGFSGDDGPAASAQLSGASGVAIDPGGNLYIADSYNRRVRRVSPDGTIQTIHVTPPAEPFGPDKVSLDAAGNVYVLETRNGLARRLSPNPAATHKRAARRRPVRRCGGGTAGSSGRAGHGTDRCAGRGFVCRLESHRRHRNTGGKLIPHGFDRHRDHDSDAGQRSRACYDHGDGGLLAPAQFTATIAPPVAAVKIIAGDNQTGALGVVLATPLEVQAVGGAGFPAPGTAVSFTVVEGAVTLSATSVFTASDGTAKVTATLGSSAGFSIVLLLPLLTCRQSSFI